MKTYFKHQKYLSFSLSELNYLLQSAFGHPVCTSRVIGLFLNLPNFQKFSFLVWLHHFGINLKFLKILYLCSKIPWNPFFGSSALAIVCMELDFFLWYEPHLYLSLHFFQKKIIFSILSIISRCPKYVFIYKRLWSFMIYQLNSGRRYDIIFRDMIYFLETFF